MYSVHVHAHAALYRRGHGGVQVGGCGGRLRRGLPPRHGALPWACCVGRRAALLPARFCASRSRETGRAGGRQAAGGAVGLGTLAIKKRREEPPGLVREGREGKGGRRNAHCLARCPRCPRSHRPKKKRRRRRRSKKKTGKKQRAQVAAGAHPLRQPVCGVLRRLRHVRGL